MAGNADPKDLLSLLALLPLVLGPVPPAVEGVTLPVATYGFDTDQGVIGLISPPYAGRGAGLGEYAPFSAHA